MEKKWAKRLQDDLKQDIKSTKAPKNLIYNKCDFPMLKLYFSRLGFSQDDHKSLSKTPKKHLKSFKISKQRVPKMDPEIVTFWGKF